MFLKHEINKEKCFQHMRDKQQIVLNAEPFQIAINIPKFTKCTRLKK